MQFKPNFFLKFLENQFQKVRNETLRTKNAILKN